MIDYPKTKPELNYNYLLELIKFCNKKFELITYKDLNLSLGYNFEFAQWKLKHNKPSLLFHFDVDANPDISMQLMKDLLKLKIKSTFMIFNKKIFDFKLKQKGILRRFTINCIGTQKTIETIRKEKSDKYNELKNERGTKEYEKYFLKYAPQEDKMKSKKERNLKKLIMISRLLK